MNTTAQGELAGDHAIPHASENKLMKALLIAAIAASSVSMIFSFGTAIVSASQDSPSTMTRVDRTQD